MGLDRLTTVNFGMGNARMPLTICINSLAPGRYICKLRLIFKLRYVPQDFTAD